MTKARSNHVSLRSFLPSNAIIMTRRASGKSNTRTIAEAKQSDLKSVAPSLSSPRSDADSHSAIAEELKDCTRCKLCKLGRSKIVLGEGNPKARLMFVGEAPGEQEDTEGRPFVGRSGQLLDKMIEAIGLSRSEVFIANVVKCRPPENRNPDPDEIEICSPYLHRQLDLIRPEVIVALGKFAAQTLLQTETRISDLRGKFQDYRGSKLMPTFHPAYLLRNPSSKKDAWADLQVIAKELKLTLPKIKNTITQ